MANPSGAESPTAECEEVLPNETDQQLNEVMMIIRKRVN